MNIDYSKRKHESPFDDDSPKIEPQFAGSSIKAESPFVNEPPPTPPIATPKSFSVHNSSEKAQFRAFMGFGFLAFGVPVSVWAYWCLTGKEYGGYPDRQLLEGSLCAAAGLLFFGIAVFLFFRSSQMFSQIKTGRLNYQPLDPQTIPKPQNRVEVRPTHFQNILLIGLIAFFAFLTIVNLWQLLNSRFTTTADIIYKGVLFHGFIITLIFVFIFLMIRAKRRSVRAFDASGVVRGDGRQFLWNDFRGVDTRIGTSRFALRYVWRKELVFADGERAWLIPQRIKNYQEVFGFVNSLPAVIPKSMEI